MTARRPPSSPRPVATFDGASSPQQDMLDFESKQRKQAPVPVDQLVEERFQTMVDEAVLDHEDARLEAKYPEFRMLMKGVSGWHPAVRATDERVWSKAVEGFGRPRGLLSGPSARFHGDTPL